MRDCPDYKDPVNTTCHVEMWCDEEKLLYDVTVEGYPEAEDVTIWSVHPCNSDGTRRECVVDDMHRVLVRVFWDVWQNADDEYRDGRYDLLQQFRAALRDAAHEAAYAASGARNPYSPNFDG